MPRVSRLHLGLGFDSSAPDVWDSIADLQQLEELHLEGHELDGEALERLGQLKQLERLTLSPLAGLPLTSLVLGCDGLDPAQLQHLPAGVEVCGLDPKPLS
ncbi:MAG TPA: hypothetical protein DEA08_02510 [Planctomycetes bacterium]|nr:hypothetical protein [Planctomycetota bacterium]